MELVTAAKYLLRFDDVCPGMNWTVWREVESVLHANGVRPLVAIVPDNRDAHLNVGPARADFWERPAFRRAVAFAGGTSSRSRDGSCARSRSRRLIGTLTACLPDSYFWNALGPPPSTSPALRWLRPRASRTLATSLGPSTPSTSALS